MIISACVEPCWMRGVIIEISDIDDQRIAIPLCPRITIKEIDSRQVFAAVDIDAAVIVNELVRDLDHLRSLRDLEWERDVRDPWYAGLEAIRDGVLSSILVVLLAFG